MAKPDAALVRTVIEAFYASVRRDPILGPIFDDIIGENWPGHLDTICCFWRHALGIEKGYSGRNFMTAHLRWPQIKVDHLPRWLMLFRNTIAVACPEECAAAFLGVATSMAESIEISLKSRDRPAPGSA